METQETEMIEPVASDAAASPLDGTEPPKKRLPLKAKIGIGVGCVLLVAGCCGVAVAMQPQPEAEQPAAQEQAAETQKQRATIKVELGEWDAAAATALVAHITGNGVDLYTALDEKGQAELDLEPGDYEVEFVPSIGADGSLLKVAGKQKLQVKGSGASISAKGEKTEAADVSKDEMSSVVDALAKAVKNGDASLRGDAGKKLLEAAKANASANPNMDEQAKAEAEAKAEEGEQAADGVSSSHEDSAPTAQAAASTSSSNAGGSNTGSPSASSPSQPSQPAHTHSWVAVTSQQWHSNPVSVWVQDSAAWDESKPVFEWVNWCTKCQCQVDITHNEQMMLAGKGGHSLTSKQVQTGTTTVHHDATGHYETQDQGWYETVTTGYQCSGCGAWQ